MGNKDEVFEYLIEQLRHRVSKFDVVAEIHKMSIDRSITGRSGYSDEENAIIDGYMGRDSDSEKIIHNLKQHLARKDDEIRTLKDQLLQAKDKVEELQGTIEHMNADFYRVTKREECEHDYRSVAWCSGLKQCTKCDGIRPETEPSNTWIENPGLKNGPVPHDHVVEVELLNGTIGVGYVDSFLWEIDAADGWSIVKYRIIK